MKLALITLAGAAALVAGCAYPTDPAPAPAFATDASAAAPSACFRTRDIRNHTIADSRTLYIGTDRDQVLRFDMAGACLSTAGPNDPLVISRVGGASDVVCRPLEIDLAVKTPGLAPMPCIIDAMTPLTPAEVAALPSKLRP